jgi:hypothetical protein
MNSNNIYLVDHQQITNGVYRSANIQSNVSQIKSNSASSTTASSLINGTGKVIFKVESDDLTNTTNFRQNNNFTNQLNNSIINNNNNITCNSNNNINNNVDIKQIKINQNFNNNNTINMNNSSTNHNNHHVNTTSPILNLGNNEKQSIKLESVEQSCIKAQLAGPGVDGKEQNPELSIYVNNVVCSYSTRCHLNLRRIAMEGMHVEYKKENGVSNSDTNSAGSTQTV